jgi:hypothetical protein
MAIQELIQLVPPPVRPCEIGSIEEWRTIEGKLGLVLPKDYNDFIFSYGSGLFAQFYRIYNPFAKEEWTNLNTSIERVCGWIRETRRNCPDHVPYHIFPEKLGLLPWGNDENGNNYYWLTDGSPDSWGVISDEVRGEGLREYNCCMTDFLCGVLTGKIEALAGDYPRIENRVFQAWSS